MEGFAKEEEFEHRSLMPSNSNHIGLHEQMGAHADLGDSVPVNLPVFAIPEEEEETKMGFDSPTLEGQFQQMEIENKKDSLKQFDSPKDIEPLRLSLKDEIARASIAIKFEDAGDDSDVSYD